MERRTFLNASIGLSALLGTGSAFAVGEQSNDTDKRGNTIRLKGNTNSTIAHWDIITIGNLSRNRYWGESEERSLHPVICTCTVIIGKDFRLIVDPSLIEGNDMASELKRRTGLSPDDIDAVFITHQHEDHHAGLSNFPKAAWYASPLTAEIINKSGKYRKELKPVGGKMFDSIDVIPIPGHTQDSTGLRFDYKGLSVFVVGDAVATKDFWDHGEVYFKALDIGEAKRSMEKIASISNIVIPGHDNYFICV